MHFRMILVVLGCCLTACSFGDPAVPSEAEQKELDAQFTRVFEGVEATEADRAGVAAVHQLAHWVRAYHDRTGEYPLARRLDAGLNYVQVQVYGELSYFAKPKPEHVDRNELLAELREELGDSVVPPVDPDPEDLQGLYYSTNRISFMVACDLVSPVNGGEMATPGFGQYTVASYASQSPAIHDINAILNGEITELAAAQWRVPALAR